MTHGKRIRTGLGIVVAVLVVAAPAGATKITVIRDVSARDASVLPSAMPIQVVRDVSARDAAALASVRPIQVIRDVSARDARLAAGEAAIAYFKANERATMKDDGEAVAATPESDVRAARADGFDWIDAGVGASSALLLALLVGVSLLAARHLRSSPVLR
jgi:hypothetical protein